MIVDADRIAREVVEPGTPGLAAVVEAFGDGVLTADGALDRPALAAVVFADAGRPRAGSTAIVHPLVRARSAELSRPSRRTPSSSMTSRCSWRPARPAPTTSCWSSRPTPETRVARLVQRGLTEDDARARIAAQATDEQRRAVADVVLDNSGTAEDLAAQVRPVLGRAGDPALS